MATYQITLAVETDGEEGVIELARRAAGLGWKALNLTVSEVTAGGILQKTVYSGLPDETATESCPDERAYTFTGTVLVSREMTDDGRLPDKDQLTRFLTDATTLQLDLESEGNPVGIACVDIDWHTLSPVGTPPADEGDTEDEKLLHDAGNTPDAATLDRLQELYTTLGHQAGCVRTTGSGIGACDCLRGEVAAFLQEHGRGV